MPFSLRNSLNSISGDPRKSPPDPASSSVDATVLLRERHVHDIGEQLPDLIGQTGSLFLIKFHSQVIVSEILGL